MPTSSEHLNLILESSPTRIIFCAQTNVKHDTMRAKDGMKKANEKFRYSIAISNLSKAVELSVSE